VLARRSSDALWQVLNSNQRRLSPRFCRLLPPLKRAWARIAGWPRGRTIGQSRFQSSDYTQAPRLVAPAAGVVEVPDALRDGALPGPGDGGLRSGRYLFKTRNVRCVTPEPSITRVRSSSIGSVPRGSNNPESDSEDDVVPRECGRGVGSAGRQGKCLTEGRLPRLWTLLPCLRCEAVGGANSQN
jgi:hypothetical protein